MSPRPMRFRARPSSSLWVAILAAAALQAAASKSPAPIPVIFGPNVNLSASSSPGATQRETTVAVNPNDPNNIVAGNIDRFPSPGNDQVCTFSFSTDGGRTWTFGGPGPLERSNDFAVDPWIAAGENGTFYYAYLEGDRLSGHMIGDTSLVVGKSTDGGRTFPTLSVAVRQGQVGDDFIAPDKDAIVADTWPASPFRGTVYLAFTNINFLAGGYQITVVVSRDGGQTWTPPAFVTPTADFNSRGLFGALPVVGRDGAVYVFYADMIFDTGPTSIMYVKSIDGGRTWARPAAAASNLPSPGFFRLKNADPKFETTSFYGINSSSMPSAAASADGSLAVSWVDFPRGSCLQNGTLDVPCTNADVRLAISKNGGRSWSAPVNATDDRGTNDQFYPAIAYHPNGLLSLSWQDKRLDPLNEDFDVFYTNTFDGATFLPNVRVTDMTSLSGKGQSPNFDYNAMAVGPDGIVPVWCDTRNSDADIYTAVGRLSP